MSQALQLENCPIISIDRPTAAKAIDGSVNEEGKKEFANSDGNQLFHPRSGRPLVCLTDVIAYYTTKLHYHPSYVP